jgi:hypothetical protein
LKTRIMGTGHITCAQKTINLYQNYAGSDSMINLDL